ncbi:hypothetical protein [Actinoplanes sp. G11-F43]|uniref:hypothetical protein n=1 Tax=Actinoplanes sp. G11-F43 TaxID=3424130 RepID=UPI003D35313A
MDDVDGIALVDAEIHVDPLGRSSGRAGTAAGPDEFSGVPSDAVPREVTTIERLPHDRRPPVNGRPERHAQRRYPTR